MKQVGKRRPAIGLESANRLQKLARDLRGDRPFIPRGVYRFRTFEEAQAWTLKMLTRAKPKKADDR